MEGICCHCGVHMAGGGLPGVFVVAAACCGVVGATDAAGAAGWLAANNAGKASDVAGVTFAVVDVPCLTASG